MSPFPRAFSETNTGQVLVLLGDGLRLSDEPLERFLAALFLQLLPDHVPAGLVVVVEPVTLEREKDKRAQCVHRLLYQRLHRQGVRGPRAERTNENKTLPLLTDR